MAISLFFDGDKRRIYEVPELSSFVVDGSGYRIYTPDDIPSADTEVSISTTDIWSRWVDYHLNNNWVLLAYTKSGGAFQYTDPTGADVFAGFDLRLINGWQIVPANYPHSLLVVGNHFPNADTGIDFDVTRLTAQGISPRVQLIAAAQTIKSTVENKLDYNTVVDIDIDGGTSGNVHPWGTSAKPINNYPDAKTIADTYSLKQYELIGVMPLGVTDSIANTVISGSNPERDGITLSGGDNSFVKLISVQVSGLANGRMYIGEDCLVGDITEFAGGIKNAELSGTITVSSACTDTVRILDSWSSIAGEGSRTIDMNNCSATLQVRGHKGGLKVTNFTQNQDASIDLDGGVCKLDSTCTGTGTIVLHGDGVLIDDDTGNQIYTGTFNGITIKNYLNNPDSTADSVWTNETRELTSAVGGGGGATPQEIWEYATRTLSTPTGIQQTDIDAITAQVWTEPTRELTTSTFLSPTEAAKLNSLDDAATISSTVWANINRTLTDSPLSLAQDTALTNIPTVASISLGVWSESTRTITSSPLTAGQASALDNIPTALDNAAAVWNNGARDLTVQTGLTLEEHNLLAAIPNEDTIATRVWANTVRDLTVQTGLTATENTQLMAIPLDDAASVSSAVWAETVRDLTVQTGLTVEENTALLAVPDTVAIAEAVWDKDL